MVVWGLNRRFVWSVVGLGVVAVGITSILRPYQRQRLSSMFAMYTGHCDIKAACYQINQSKIGLGTGGILGTGPSHARTLWGFLPNANTDFIASVVGEMFGFVGMCVLVVLLAALVFSTGQSALNTDDMTSRLVAFGIMSWFGFEAIVNLGSVVGWVPVTGIPLPLMSYGGTALIVNLFALGLVANIAAHNGLNRSDRFLQSVRGAFWMS